MPITYVAESYLNAFLRDEPIEGGLHYRSALQQIDLDFSKASLERIDGLLDQLRAQLRPEPNAFLSDQGNVNFLYFLAFYVGKVVAMETQAHIEWYQYREMIALMPGNKAFFPNCFGTSVTCVLSGGTRKGGFFVPLASIESRAFEANPDKSVAFSAGAFL